jgi:hypothetical protein
MHLFERYYVLQLWLVASRLYILIKCYWFIDMVMLYTATGFIQMIAFNRSHYSQLALDIIYLFGFRIIISCNFSWGITLQTNQRHLNFCIRRWKSHLPARQWLWINHLYIVTIPKKYFSIPLVMLINLIEAFLLPWLAE